jgi:hypothetical protein
VEAIGLGRCRGNSGTALTEVDLANRCSILKPFYRESVQNPLFFSEDATGHGRGS